MTKSVDIKLAINRKWFEMILSGEKTEEYRDIKPYYEKRLKKLMSKEYGKQADQPIIENIHLFNGGYYSEDLPNVKLKFKGIEVREGKEKWRAVSGTKYFVIKLEDIVSLKS